MRQLQPGEPAAIGSYRVVGALGAGGMGQVFLGVGPDGRLAAIKQKLSSFANDPDFRARFAGEVEASRKVSGAYTAAVLDADPSAATPWLASVFVAGPPLDDAVEAHGPLPIQAMRLVTVGLVIALREIHRVGLVHRDLKPSNVLLTEEGPRVIDFGIATAGDRVARLTQTGAVIGSPGFMSPEQVLGQTATAASDVFSLGAVLTYATTGVGPFGDAPAPTLMHRVAYLEPDLSRVPSPVRELVTPCLAKDPSGRPTLDQILQVTGPVQPGDLWVPAPILQLGQQQQEQARRLAGTAHRHAAAQPGQPPAAPAVPGSGGPRRSRRTAGVLVGAGALALVIAVALGLLYLLPSDEHDPEEAAALVTAIAPGADATPDGYTVSDEDARTRSTNPLEFDRSQTAFACVLQSDAPTASEAGIIALSRGSFTEDASEVDVRLVENRSLDRIFFSVAYLDTNSRSTIMAEIRVRIRECVDGGVRQGIEDFRFSRAETADVDEAVGFFAAAPVRGPEGTDPPPQVVNCEFARVDGVVLRSCAAITNDTGSRSGRDEDVARLTGDLMAQLVGRARQEQGAA